MPISANLVNGMFSLLGVAIGGLVGYSVSVSVNTRKEFNQAAIEFHATFFDVIMNLNHRYYTGVHDEVDTLQYVENNTCTIIKRTFHNQMKAMLRFRQYLPKSKRAAFDSAWREYCHYKVDGEPDYPFVEQYFEKHFEGQPTRELALQRIEKLMSFAELSLAPPFEPEGMG